MGRRRQGLRRVDNEETTDVDIIDITDPKKAFLTAEYDLAAMFPQILQAAPANLTEVFHHDMIVKEINGRQIMLISYWDAGYVTLDTTDVHHPTYIGDNDFTNPDPELLEWLGRVDSPEGNGHEAEFTLDNQYVIAADEDFGASRGEGSTDDDPEVFESSQGGGTVQVGDLETMSGDTVVRHERRR
jgi:hypothetical protein